MDATAIGLSLMSLIDPRIGIPLLLVYLVFGMLAGDRRVPGGAFR